MSLRNQAQDDERVSEVCYRICIKNYMSDVTMSLELTLLTLLSFQVRRLLNSGTFYFCWSSTGDALDLTLCAQRRTHTNETDNRFFWLVLWYLHWAMILKICITTFCNDFRNRMLHIHLLRFSVNCSQWLLKTMCGSVEIRTVYTGSRKAQAAVVSRLSCERAGTRWVIIRLLAS